MNAVEARLAHGFIHEPVVTSAVTSSSGDAQAFVRGHAGRLSIEGPR